MTPGGKGGIIGATLTPSTPPRPKNPRAVAFGRELRSQMMNAGNVSSRELGRRLASKDLSASAARRSVMKYLAGDVLPSVERTAEIAHALGIKPEDLSVPDEDEESDLMLALTRALQNIAQLEVERAVERELRRNQPEGVT